MEHQRRRGKRQRSHNATAAADNFNFPASLAKRLRRPTPTTATTEDIDVDVHGDDGFKSSSSSSPLVMVTGLPSDCTVLELKSRLEMYGPISRTRIDALDGAGYVTFRSAASAESAIAASLDPAFGVAIRSSKVIKTNTDQMLEDSKYEKVHYKSIRTITMLCSYQEVSEYYGSRATVHCVEINTVSWKVSTNGHVFSKISEFCFEGFSVM